MSGLYFSVLGPPSLRHGDTTLAFSTRKALALLVYLAVEGRLHTRERLAALFWPDADPRHARSMLRYTVVTVRRAIGDHPDQQHLLVARDLLGLDFASGVDLDLHTLEAVYTSIGRADRGKGFADPGSDAVTGLRHAVRLYRGEALEGLTLPDAEDFNSWVDGQRALWQQRVEAVSGRLTRLLADRGEQAEAVDAARQWLAINPLNEEAHRQLMRLLLAAGNRTAALQAYELCRAVLLEQLGIRPAPETEALAERARFRASPSSAPAWEPPASSDGLGVSEGPMVDRSEEFTKLIEAYYRVRSGRTHVALLRGEAGIGKTRLAREFQGWVAAQGADVLLGRAFETGGRLPYQPLVDALRPRLEEENAPEDLLSDTWLVELSRLLPELRDRYPDLPVPAGDEAAARTRLFEAIARLGLALAKRAPVVLLLDDLHWADAGSLDILHYAGRRWTEDRAPLLVLLTLRSEAVAETPALDAWLAHLQRDVAVTVLDLEPLSYEDTVRWVRGVSIGARAVDEEQHDSSAIEGLARWLFAETSGQPLFLVEAIRGLVESGALVRRQKDDGSWTVDLAAGSVGLSSLGSAIPPGVRQVVHERLARLGPEARQLMAAAAVLGQGFSFEQLCRVADLSEASGLTAIDEVLRAHLLREVATSGGGSPADSYTFSHDRVRDVVYSGAGDARRRVFHRRALEMLDGTGPSALLAAHAMGAGLEKRAVELNLRAGDEAMALLAARDALACYDRAMESAGRLEWAEIQAELHAGRGRAYASIAQWADARRELEAALDALTVDQREERAEVLVSLLEACWWLLDVPALRRRGTEARALAADLRRSDLESAAIGWLAAATGADGDVATCVEECERAVARAHEAGLPTPPQVHTYISLSFYWLGLLEEAIRRSEEGIQAARAKNHTSAMMWCLPHLGIALAAKGQYGDALRVFAEARRYGSEYGVSTLLARAIAMSAGFRLDVFDFAGNERLAEEARELARSLGFPPPAVSAGIDLLLNYARRRAIPEAEKLLPEVAAAVQSASGFHGWLWSLRLAEARAEIALARGDMDSALDWARQTVEQSRTRKRVKYEALALSTRARALHALGRTNEALADFRDGISLARSVGDPALLLCTATGLLAVGGDDELTGELTRAARQIARELPDPQILQTFEASEPVGLIRRLTSGSEGSAPR